MKTLFLTCVVLFSVLCFSQVPKEDLDIIKAKFSKDKKMLVEQYMHLESPGADAFWKTYYEYEDERTTLSVERLKILSDYAKDYDLLTDKQAEDLAKRVMANEQSFISLRKSYLKKFTKAAGAKNAAKFLQLDIYLQTIIRKEIMESTPFIDEF